MALVDQFTLANDATFKQKVGVAIVKTAETVQAESLSVNHHAVRARLAFDVLRSPSTWAPIFAYAVAANPAIVTGSTDQAILDQVALVWDALSAPVVD